jgi:hypothetical protein
VTLEILLDTSLPVEAGFRAEHAETITLHCSDGRYTRAVALLLKELGLPRYDTMSLPGGPALLDMWSATMVEVDVFRASTSFLVKGHNTQNAVLIAHEGCGFYSKRYAGQSKERIQARQKKDLRSAGAWLQRAHPKLKVQLFLAQPMAEDGKVFFTPVKLGTVTDILF